MLLEPVITSNVTPSKPATAGDRNSRSRWPIVEGINGTEPTLLRRRPSAVTAASTATSPNARRHEYVAASSTRGSTQHPGTKQHPQRRNRRPVEQPEQHHGADQHRPRAPRPQQRAEQRCIDRVRQREHRHRQPGGTDRDTEVTGETAEHPSHDEHVRTDRKRAEPECRDRHPGTQVCARYAGQPIGHRHDHCIAVHVAPPARCRRSPIVSAPDRSALTWPGTALARSGAVGTAGMTGVREAKDRQRRAGRGLLIVSSVAVKEWGLAHRKDMRAQTIGLGPLGGGTCRLLALDASR